MPELPEMENYKNQLQSHLIGKEITEVTVNRSKSINVAKETFQQQVHNRKILDVERRAKYLLFHLDSGKQLLLHLMLGGKMYLGSQNDSPDRTKQVVLSFGSVDLFFIGLRLGYLHLLSPEQVEQEMGDLGPDPLSPELTLDNFRQRLETKRSMLKSALVDQSWISGIGNRYSDEICFAAALSPEKKVNELDQEEVSRLHIAIQDVLAEATHLGGYMDMPFYKGDNTTGGYLPYFKVHGREEEPCPRCGTPVVVEEVASHKTYYCPNCQKE
ncbi:DNA-formamidopyrimidine glycosylase [Tuberibacillus sp. Marseille-P3662]|uniref:DNA-formamidopyrimidine glycosylase n=1 Tax=Tuberibacillus sp. Marseille-P3662 TaxID=1965358 RepID=UPI000A1CE7F9|nr:DNA-formamidopyrimidine glycosylase [Tuberibacillus sp. Marseille-P3662]